ncbi:MAG: hypothetical protein EB141_04825 [Verrucomicrobia bacterium]|nr:hypothetical protein [Verrucomicrobiota bacterium]
MKKCATSEISAARAKDNSNPCTHNTCRQRTMPSPMVAPINASETAKASGRTRAMSRQTSRGPWVHETSSRSHRVN